MRKKIVAGNWKMNVDLSESIDLIESIKKIYHRSEDVEVWGNPILTIFI